MIAESECERANQALLVSRSTSRMQLKALCIAKALTRQQNCDAVTRLIELDGVTRPMPQCTFEWEAQVQGRLAGNPSFMSAYEGHAYDHYLEDICVNTAVI